MIYALTKSQQQPGLGSGALAGIHGRLWHCWVWMADVHNGSIGRVLNKNFCLLNRCLQQLVIFCWSLKAADEETEMGNNLILRIT